MATKLITALIEGEEPTEELYRMWRNDYRADTEQGALSILQLALDLTGFCYELKDEVVEHTADLREFVRTKFIKSSYYDSNVFNKPAVLKRISHLFELMISRDYKELLLDNMWLNWLVRLLIAFCESEEDECKMVGGYLSALVLANLAYVRDQLDNHHDTSQLDDDDSEPTGSPQHRQYLLKIFRIMVRNVEGNCAYTMTLPIICELTCQMLETYPREYVVENSVLHVLTTFLRHRHTKMFQTVAFCLRNLLNIDNQEAEVAEKVANFFIESLEKRFTHSMFTYKSCEKVCMEVVVFVQRLNYGKEVFSEDIVDKLRQQMFHAEEMIRGYAIDFHVCTLCSPDDTDNSKNLEILQHILRLYVRYEHPIDSLTALITDLWQLEFFDDWDIVFKLLDEESARKDNLFMIYSVVHVINQYFALLMKDLEQKSASHSRLLGLLKSFTQGYPSCLLKCANYEHAYTILLQSADASFHAHFKKYSMNIDQYYCELFAVLEDVAHTGRNFYMLHKNLAVIRGYWNIIMDVEQIWSDLLQEYADKLLETRMKINSRNIGKSNELSEQYAECVTRLTAFLELDHDVKTHLPHLKHVLYTDFRLLEKMQLTREQMSIFYRLYKCLFHVIVQARQAETAKEHSLKEPIAHLQQTGNSLKKRVMELIRVLIKQLQKYDESLDTSVHMFISLCDMLLVTQNAVGDLGIAELEAIVYPVQPALLQKMAKFLLYYLFSKKDDWHDAPVIKQKQMLMKYVQLYDLHKSLPGITDTHFIVANFAIDTVFDKQLRDLMKVLHRADPSQFCEVIAQAAFQLLQGYKSESNVKNFFAKFQSFALGKLTAENKEDYHTVMAKVMEKILNNLMHILSDPGPSTAESKRMFKLIEPLLPDVPIEDRLTMEHLLMRHPEYDKLSDSDRRAVNRFVKHLNPQD
ncbi:uncharacterized protein LOC134212686 [Armigeres subalbatus]|uniref:uncharacterized protein LOC134212686 n=1 Tax=Armigeres subalbatus TaxID=124917 RepID=UPI002ED679D4